MGNNSSEKLLASYASDNSGESFDASLQIHSRYQNRLILLAKKRLLGVLKSKIDPDDIAQETFAAFFAMADQNEVRWKERGDLWRLLAGIAINKVKQQFERYSTLKRDLKTETRLPEATSQVGDRDVVELAELVEHVLESEKPLVTTVLNLRLAGFSFEEIAQRVGRSTRTIRRLLESLKAKLITDQELSLRLSVDSTIKPSIDVVDYHDFHLLRMIGQGSFAKVYLAKQITSGQLFAVKAIKKKWLKNEDVRQSFYREAEILMSLSDPSFVQTYGIGKLPNGGYFLLLEWIEGDSLATRVETAAYETRLVWASELHQATERLHAKNLTHGDICANNVMIDNNDNIKLLDFGLGQQTSGHMINARLDLHQLETLRNFILPEQAH